MLRFQLALLLFLFAAWGIFLLSSLGDFLLDIYKAELFCIIADGVQVSRTSLI